MAFQCKKREENYILYGQEMHATASIYITDCIEVGGCLFACIQIPVSVLLNSFFSFSSDFIKSWSHWDICGTAAVVVAIL